MCTCNVNSPLRCMLTMLLLLVSQLQTMLGLPQSSWLLLQALQDTALMMASCAPNYLPELFTER